MARIAITSPNTLLPHLLLSKDVPPSIDIAPLAGHIQHASASDVFGVGIGNVNDDDGRTALAASSFGQGLLNNSATDGGLRRNGHVATGVGTAPPPFPATDNGAVVTAPVAPPLISQSLYSNSRNIGYAGTSTVHGRQRRNGGVTSGIGTPPPPLPATDSGFGVPVPVA